MSEPVRLRDDPATPKAQKRLLRNEAMLDVGYDVEQGLSRFRQAIESGSMPAARSRSKAAAVVWKTVRGAALSSVWLWIALPAAATGLWAAARATATRQDVNATLQHAGSVQPPRAAAPRAALTPRSAEPIPRSVSEAAPTVPSAAAPEPTEPAAGPGRKPGLESRDSQLLAETEHMAELRRLAAADPARALTRAEQGAQKFPRGFFAQEREAISITLLLRVGRSQEARVRGERFLARYPQGPAAEQIRRAMQRD
jgi:hypothetical protein